MSYEDQLIREATEGPSFQEVHEAYLEPEPEETNDSNETGTVLRTMYKVNTGPRRNRYFKTLQRARVYCSQVFERSGVVLSIVETKH